MQITWLGHSGFRIEIGEAVLLVDPWFSGNPVFDAAKRAEVIKGATHILISHGHSDHAADAVALSQELNIPIATIHELAVLMQAQGAPAIIGFNKGGTIDCKGVKVTMVNATHSASYKFGEESVVAGSAAGFMIAGEGHVIYFSGDTDIMADMEWMAEYHKPDIGILSCGGHYTMDMDRAAWAVRKYFNFQWVIPCHYKTFGALEQDVSVLRQGLPTGVNLLAPEVMGSVSI